MKKVLITILFCFSLMLLVADGIDEIYELSCDLDAQTNHCVINAVTNIGNVQVQGFEAIREWTQWHQMIMSQMKMGDYSVSKWGCCFVCRYPGTDCFDEANRLLDLYEDILEYNNL